LRDNYHYANTEAVDTWVMLDRRILAEIFSFPDPERTFHWFDNLALYPE